MIDKVPPHSCRLLTLSPMGGGAFLGWGFFGFNVMFRPPLGTLPSSMAHFQVSVGSVGLEPMGDRVKKLADLSLRPANIM